MKKKWGHLALGSLAALVAGWLYAAPAQSATYYVDQANGSASDSNPGSQSLPWKTLYRAMTQSLQPGDTVVVKPGTYDASAGGSWSEPTLHPRTSGVAGSPITFRAEPRYGATIQGGTAAPAIGSRYNNYIVIDGFVVTSHNPKGIGVFGADRSNRVKGVVIQNNIIHSIYNSDPYDNTEGIRFDYASGTIIRNNKIYDIHNGTDFYNASGIKSFHADNSLVENNEIYNAPAGVYDKEEGVNNVYRNNYFHDLTSMGIQFHAQNQTPVYGNQVYQNIFNNCGTNVVLDPNSDSPIGVIWVYNNVFANYRTETGLYSSKVGGPMNLYNNIFYRSNVPLWGDVDTYDDPPVSLGLVNYNLYPSNLKIVIGKYVTNRTFTALSSWTAATGFDRNSVAGDPGFVNAAGNDFHLRADSVGVNAGRVGGTSAGAAINMGAYPKGTEVIGLLKDGTPPMAPVLLNVQ